MIRGLVFGRVAPRIAAAAGSVLITISLLAGLPEEQDSEKQPSPEKTSDAPPAEKQPPLPTVEAARGQARVLQTVYETSLHMMHHYYFEDDQRLQIPAKSLEDVFEVADSEYDTQTHWISVSAPPMNIDNKPDSPFEKEAARLLRAGREEFEKVEDGKYYRAGAITLRAVCLHCHVSALKGGSDHPPVAGIVMVIPVKNP